MRRTSCFPYKSKYGFELLLQLSDLAADLRPPDFWTFQVCRQLGYHQVMAGAHSKGRCGRRRGRAGGPSRYAAARWAPRSCSWAPGAQIPSSSGLSRRTQRHALRLQQRLSTTSFTASCLATLTTSNFRASLSQHRRPGTGLIRRQAIIFVSSCWPEGGGGPAAAGSTAGCPA